jgi:hypothetical protein
MIVTPDMITAQTRGKTRVNLHVYACAGNGKTIIHVIHLGYFTTGATAALSDGLDMRGLAGGSNVPRQLGRVQMAVMIMRPGQREHIIRHEVYVPRLETVEAL